MSDAVLKMLGEHALPQVPRPIGLGSRLLLGLTTPFGVGIVMLGGVLILRGLNLNLHGSELVAAILISLVAGGVALAPLIVWANQPADILCRAVLGGMALRALVVLLGAGLALRPGWQLNHEALIAWLVAFYVMLLVVDTGSAIWLMRRQGSFTQNKLTEHP